MSHVSELPSQTKRSTRLPNNGTARRSSVSSPSAGSSGHSIWVGKYGFSVGGGAAHVQKRYTYPLFSNSGWSAMPRRPRSELEFTARSSTAPRTEPFITCITWPVFFSNTNISSSPTKAMLIGVVNPLATVLTSRPGSNRIGSWPPPSWAPTGVRGLRAITSASTSTNAAALTKRLLPICLTSISNTSCA